MPTQMIFVGHSHVRRFGSFTRGAFNGRPQANLGLTRGDFRFACHGEGGMRLDQLNRPNSASHLFLQLFRGSQTCIMFIGDNDVANYDPQYLARLIMDKALFIRSEFNMRNIGIVPLFPRHRGAHGNVNRYNADAGLVNHHLRAMAQGTGITILTQLFAFPAADQTMYQRQAPMFRNDGVHLSEFGNRRLYNYLRGVAIRSTR